MKRAKLQYAMNQINML